MVLIDERPTVWRFQRNSASSLPPTSLGSEATCPHAQGERPVEGPCFRGATIVIASHWVGLTLPGMIEEPGSFAGRLSSPRPQRGPEPAQRMSLAIFMSEHA